MLVQAGLEVAAVLVDILEIRAVQVHQEKVDLEELEVADTIQENQVLLELAEDQGIMEVCRVRYIVIQEMDKMDSQDKKDLSLFIQQERSYHDVVTN